MNLIKQSWRPEDLDPELRHAIDALKQGPQDDLPKSWISFYPEYRPASTGGGPCSCLSGYHYILTQVPKQLSDLVREDGLVRSEPVRKFLRGEPVEFMALDPAEFLELNVEWEATPQMNRRVASGPKESCFFRPICPRPLEERYKRRSGNRWCKKIVENNQKEPEVNTHIVYVKPSGTTWQKVLKHLARWNQIRWYSGECPTHLIPEAAVQVLHLDIAKDHGTLSYNCNPTELYDNTYVVDSLDDLRSLTTKYLGAPAPKCPEHISWSDLRYTHACSAGLQWFEATFGLNACVEYETLKRLAGERNPTWPDWLDKHFAK